MLSKYQNNMIDELAKELKLNKKETRLLRYRYQCIQNNVDPTIGEACKALGTTVFTLLGKTEPNLNRKIKEYNSRHQKQDIQSCNNKKAKEV